MFVMVADPVVELKPTSDTVGKSQDAPKSGRKSLRHRTPENTAPQARLPRIGLSSTVPRTTQEMIVEPISC